jgi:chromosome segregation protein
VFLKALDIKGFKSFADPTTLEFEPGVTVVVGPNGSGKSNVVDAVAWVLGAQGPRTVRSGKMEDVIFAGTPKRAALGRAEVSLTIDNSAGLIPIAFSEVTITRTLFRTGESEYAINRVPCRLLDVQELLSDTGVGRQQHVIVSQGNLDAILNSRPEDRRLVIEEAAGVLKYRRRKEKSERRLESTESSLQRLQDLQREVRRQLRPLEKQADAARRHGDLATELEALRRYLAGRQLVAIEARLVASAHTRQELRRSETEVRGALAALDADVIEAEAELGVVRQRDELADLAEAVSRAEGLRARAGGLAALLDQRRHSLERELSVAVDHDVIASLEVEATGLAVALDATIAEADALAPEALELSGAEAALAQETLETQERWQHRGAGASDLAAEVRGELGALRAAAERAQSQRARLDARVVAAGQRAARIEAETERLRATAVELDASGPGLAEVASGAEAALAGAEADHSAAEERRRRADGERHRWHARAEALALALDAARARAGAERLAGITGFVGTLLEVVDVAAGLEAAFEAAAGEVLSAVVTDGTAAAARSLAELRRQGAGGAVVALPDLAPAPAAGPGSSVLSPAPDDLPPGATWMRTQVRSPLPAVSAFLDELLAPAVLVASWPAAVDLAAARPDLVVVTADGDRFSRRLWRTGAGGAGTTGAALAEARHLGENALAEAEVAEEALRTARQSRDAAKSARDEAVRAVDAHAARRRSTADAMGRIEAERAEGRAEADAAAHEAEEMKGRLGADDSRVAELEGRLVELEAAAGVEADGILAERADRSRLAQRAAGLASWRQDLEVRIASFEERRRMLTSRLTEVEARLRRNVEEREGAASRREGLTRQAAAGDRLATLVADRQEDVAAALDRLRAARQAQSQATRDVTDRLDRLRRERAGCERQLSEGRERVSRAELEDAEARVRLETLTESVRRELDCEPEATRAAECPPLPPATSAAGRRTELERELRLMGPINPLALEEFTALNERHTFLEAQLDDVRSARRELTKVIRAVDAEIVEVFRAAYTDVADNFEKLFATLFPGGQGRLRLTDPDHLLDTGIEIEARPSGKNVRRLSLLSGGERSLTAMAFLFAVFRSRPSPFYLMDEVEAALDDVNLHRFLDLVDEFRSEAQLMIVTHQKRTMEAADCLYGVTMAPGGSSRVVSEKVRSGNAPAVS